MPDEVKRRQVIRRGGSASSVEIDVFDGFFEFAQAFPWAMKKPHFWSRKVYPLNWRVYMGGLSYLRREQSRQNLRMFRAMNYATVGGKKAENWVLEQITLAGW